MKKKERSQREEKQQENENEIPYNPNDGKIIICYIHNQSNAYNAKVVYMSKVFNKCFISAIYSIYTNVSIVGEM